MSSDLDGPEEADAGRLPAGWLLLRADSLPAAWEQRAHDYKLIPLLPSEADNVLEIGSTDAHTDAEELRLMQLVAAGWTVNDIAEGLWLHPRTVQRRMAQLRERFSVDTKAELAALLARRGFGGKAPRRHP